MAKGKMMKSSGMSGSGGGGRSSVKGFGSKGYPMTKGAANAPVMPKGMKGKMPKQKQPVS